MKNLYFNNTLLLFLLAFSMLASLLTHAQNYPMSNDTIMGCGGTFSDDNGVGNPYSPNQDYTITFCPDQIGQKIRLEFDASTILGAGDTLFVYSGDDTSGIWMGSFVDNALLNGAVEALYGCLTLRFTSDNATEAEGWFANILCIGSCQPIDPYVSSSIPMIDSTLIIRSCINDSIILNTTVNYPFNDESYHQRDSTSTFLWSFGDNNSSNSQNTAHAYTNPGIYFISLNVIDSNGCVQDKIMGKAFINGLPEYSGTFPQRDSSCLGDTLMLFAGAVPVVNSVFIGVDGGAVFIPDNLGTPYTTTMDANIFDSAATMAFGTDIEQICMNMEHSWMHDIEITLVCPNGSSIILHDHPGNTTGTGGPCDLGIPVTSGNAPGVGWDYCWNMNATNGTFIQYNDANSPGALPAGDYNPFDPFGNLVGCPLNGQWTIEIVDYWGGDNGYVFSWGIDFAPHLYSDSSSFSAAIVDYYWTSTDSLLTTHNDTVLAYLNTFGINTYQLHSEDEYGCIFDTTIAVYVEAPPEANFSYVNGCDLAIPTSFTNLSQQIGTSPIDNYLWDLNDGNSSIDIDPIHQYQLSGFYDVQLTAENIMGCKDDTVIGIFVKPSPLTGFLASTECVNGDSTTFIDKTQITYGSIVQWEWDFADGNTSSNSMPKHDYDSAGVYPVKLWALSDSGCYDSIIVDVVINDKPNAYYTYDINDTCVPLCVQFTDSSWFDAGAIVSHYWKFGDGNVSYNPNPGFCYNKPGNWLAMLIAENNFGCFDTLVDTMYARPFPIANFEPTPAVTTTFQSTVLFRDLSTGANQWIYDFRDSTALDTNNRPVHNFLNAGFYDVKLVVYNEFGCGDTTYQLVEIQEVPTAYLPNAFTPNKDGYNDVFNVEGFGITDKDFELQIFDRWGNLIFQTNESLEGWNGKIDGTLAKQDVYIYKVSFRDMYNKPKFFQGSVALLPKKQ